jgi:DNA-binding NtrC family response regulator
VPSGRILIVEDRASLRKMLEHALAAEGYTVAVAASAEEGARRLGEDAFDLVLTDLKLPGASGLEMVKAARAAQPPAAAIVMTAYGTVGSAVEAMKLGAVDFLEKPVEIDELLRRVAASTAGGEPAEVFRAPGCPPIVGAHPRLRAALRLLERVAPTESTVLLLGESGTGKELFARALHALSPRARGPFVALNVAAIPDTLVENELFGHEKGAFTGADRARPGRFEQAQGGTLLLDEIGELPLAAQGKVLRVLEERTFERVGGGATRRADVRLVAATNRNLRAMVEEGAFRSDLYFRLDVFPIELPPLRERRSDVPALARHLVAEIAARHGGGAPELGEDALALLAEADWPGNVRELANVLERAVILTSGAPLAAADLRPLLRPLAGAGERERLRDALRQSGGDKRRAAALLGVSYRTLQRWVKAGDLEGYPRYRE